MLKAIVVDDEKKALVRFERMIKSDERIDLIGSFTKPLEAMDFLKVNTVDIVFLDIEMPSVNGLELAENIFEEKPEVDVVFVTAYDRYALQAFQAHAIGYLLKPIDADDFQKQTDIIFKKRQARTDIKNNHALNVKCMGGFICYNDGEETVPLKFRTAKAEELIALLIHHQGSPVSKERIMDLLWPEMDTEKASKNLHATCYYIRDVLLAKGHGDLFIRSRGQYQIKADRLKCDLYQLLHLIDKMDSNSLEALEQVDLLYKGAYLEDKSYEWAMNMRTWLETRYEESLLKLAKQYALIKKNDKAETILKKLIYQNPISEAAYKLLIETYIQKEDHTNAILFYKKYESALQKELGIEPSEEINKLFD